MHALVEKKVSTEEGRTLAGVEIRTWILERRLRPPEMHGWNVDQIERMEEARRTNVLTTPTVAVVVCHLSFRVVRRSRAGSAIQIELSFHRLCREVNLLNSSLDPYLSVSSLSPHLVGFLQPVDVIMFKRAPFVGRGRGVAVVAMEGGWSVALKAAGLGRPLHTGIFCRSTCGFQGARGWSERDRAR